MSESQVCLNAQSVIEALNATRALFRQAYDTYALSRSTSDLDRMVEAKTQLKEKMQALKELTTLSRMERILDLRKQYHSQVDLLLRTGFIKQYPGEKGECYCMGLDERVYPVPSFQDILQQITERHAALEIKADQGFKKLLLVPFGMDLHDLVSKFSTYLVDYDERHGGKLMVHPTCPVWGSTLTTNGNEVENLEYEDQPGMDMYQTKRWIQSEQLQRDAWDKGWRVVLLQEAEEGEGVCSIPKTHEEKLSGTIIKRLGLEAGKSPSEYRNFLDQQKKDPSSAYYAESGMTFETWIFACMRHFEETGTTLDGYNNPGTSGYLIGARLKKKETTSPSWDCQLYGVTGLQRSSYQETSSVDLSGYDDTNREEEIGIRTEVRI